jgi:polyhydroxyalkanoate synthesis regulator phasin
MDARLKQLLYLAVGLASTSSKAKILLDKMEIEGKLTEEQGKHIIDEVINSAKSAGSNVKDELSNFLNDLLSELQTPTKKEFVELQEKVAKLEQGVGST